MIEVQTLLQLAPLGQSTQYYHNWSDQPLSVDGVTYQPANFKLAQLPTLSLNSTQPSSASILMANTPTLRNIYNSNGGLIGAGVKLTVRRLDIAITPLSYFLRVSQSATQKAAYIFTLSPVTTALRGEVVTRHFARKDPAFKYLPSYRPTL